MKPPRELATDDSDDRGGCSGDSFDDVTSLSESLDGVWPADVDVTQTMLMTHRT